MSTPRVARADLQPQLSAGEEALRRADWLAAHDAFRAALAVSDSPEAREGLAFACYWQGDVKGVVEAKEAAYRLYQERGERRAAARVATWLALEYETGRGQSAVANGWLQRAHRLLLGLEPSPELGARPSNRGDRHMSSYGARRMSARDACGALRVGAA